MYTLLPCPGHDRKGKQTMRAFGWEGHQVNNMQLADGDMDLASSREQMTIPAEPGLHVNNELPSCAATCIIEERMKQAPERQIRKI